MLQNDQILFFSNSNQKWITVKQSAFTAKLQLIWGQFYPHERKKEREKERKKEDVNYKSKFTPFGVGPFQTPTQWLR